MTQDLALDSQHLAKPKSFDGHKTRTCMILADVGFGQLFEDVDLAAEGHTTQGYPHLTRGQERGWQRALRKLNNEYMPKLNGRRVSLLNAVMSPTLREPSTIKTTWTSFPNGCDLLATPRRSRAARIKRARSEVWKATRQELLQEARVSVSCVRFTRPFG